MIYVFDTDLFTLAERRDSPEYSRLHARIAQLSSDDAIATTIITYEEQTRGWLGFAAKSKRIEHQIRAYAQLRRHLQIYQGWEVLDFDRKAGDAYEHLQTLKLRIGTCDLKIAAITMSLTGRLLTRNLSDFRRVPGLDAEDWTQS